MGRRQSKSPSAISVLFLDIAQVSPEHAVYVDDRLLFVEVARGLGIPSLYHETLDGTPAALAPAGLKWPRD